MSIAPPSRLELVWMQSELLWVAQTNDEQIAVDCRLSAQVMREHCASLGMTWHTWTHYLRTAEEAWARQQHTEQLLRAHGVASCDIPQLLLRLGMTWHTWSHYLHAAEEAWRRQCQEENILRANLDFWKQVPGVRVVRTDTVLIVP